MSLGLQISHAFFSFTILLISLTLLSPAAAAAARSLLNPTNETDWQALISIKRLIVSDPYKFLASWNNSTDFCKWKGVTCSIRHQRVVALNFSGMELKGTVSPCIGNLTFLKDLKLDNNFFRGKIPQEIGRLYRLQHISLSNNTFHGEIPDNLTQCSDLRDINLDRNMLQECGMGGPVSTLADVYSYGILLLEMFSGRRPTDSMFIDDLSLHNYAKMAIPNQVLSIADPRLLSAELESHRTASQARDYISEKTEKCLASIFHIGVRCSAPLPRVRMDIADALMELKAIRDVLLRADETEILKQE